MYCFSQRILILLLFLLPTLFVQAEDKSDLSMPLVFRENAGQWDKGILFKGSSSSANVFFTKSGMQIAHTRKVATMDPGKEDELENLYWEISFVGALENVKVRPAAAAESYTNYLIGPESQHRTHVRDYNELRYESLYKGIDLRYYAHKGELKYDFILAPGARIEDIKLNCEGIKNIRLNKQGELEIAHKWGTVLEKKPYSYQEINGEKVEVDIRYEIKQGNTYGYKLYGNYDVSKQIVIDPLSITWGTYVGGTNVTVSGYQYDITVDADGFAYGTGYYPQYFPATAGSYDNSYNGGFGDVFVYKMSQGGSSLIYATYVGGSEDDRGMAITVNSSGEAYVGGYTFTPPNGFPKTVQFGPTASSSNAFVFKLNSSGSGLIYSAYIGANDQESVLDIALNSAGEAIVVGETKSYDFPMAAVSYDNTYNGAPYDGFFIKINAAGTAMLSSGFLGGLRDDRAKGVAIDKNNNVYITGYTGSSNFPVSPGAYDNSYNGGLDVFIMKFNPAMTTPQYSTFIGGSYDEEGMAIDVNDHFEPVITGYTFSPNYPVTIPGAYAGLKDMILTKLTQNGSGFVYSRMISGNNNDVGTSLQIDKLDDNVYLVGTTNSTNGTTVSTPILPEERYRAQPFHNGGIVNLEYNVFFAAVCKQGSIEEKGLIGGYKDDYNKPAIGIINKARVCEVFIGFTSHSDDLPTTLGSYQPHKRNGGVENDQLALFKVKVGEGKDSSKQSVIPVCSPTTLTLCDQETITKFCIPGVTTQTCSTYTFPNPTTGARYTIAYEDNCKRLTQTFIYRYVDTLKGYIAGPDKICEGDTAFLDLVGKDGIPISFSMLDSPQFLWSTGATTPFIEIFTGGKYWVRITNLCGHVFSDTFTVKTLKKPIVDLGSDKTFCFPASTTLIASNPADTIPTTYKWTPFGQTSPVITAATPDTFCVTKTNECGAANDCIIISKSPKPSVDLGRDTSICNGRPITLNAGTSGTAYYWSPGGQTTQTIQVSTPGTYSVRVFNSCGFDDDTIQVSLVAAPPLVNLGADLLLCNASDFPHTLDAGNPGSNYYWSTRDSTQTISITKGGNYFVTVTNGCGQDRDTITITAPPSLGLDLGPDTVLCSPASITLNAGNAGATYLWSPGGQTTQTRTVSNTSGNYSVTVTNACGTASDNINITFQSGLPVVSLGANRTICPGTPTTLDAGSAPNQTYHWSTGASTSSITVLTAGTYWVDVTNKCGTTRATVTLSNGLPSFSLGPDKSICAPATATLDATGAGNSFSWSTGAVTASITASATGIYWVDVTNTCGTTRDSIHVTVSAGAPVVNLGPDQLQCTSPFTVSLDAGNPGATYQWLPGAQTSQAITVSTGGSYIVTATNGCGSSTDTLKITTQAVPALGPDKGICQGGAITLDAGNPGATYLWTPGGATTQTIQVTASGTYGVTITNGCGSITDDITLTLFTGPPSVDLGTDKRLCAPATIMLDAANPGASYLWSTGAVSQTISANSTGIYKVTVSNGCGTAIDEVSVIVDAGIPVVDLGPDQSFCKPLSYPLDAGTGAASYDWNTGAKSQMLFVTNSGNYSVTATNACGTASDNIQITAFDPALVALKDTGGCINPVVLDAHNAGGNYYWMPGGQTTQTISAATTGVYSVRVTNSCGISSGSAYVVINSGLPTIALGADTNLCNPSGFLLDAGLQPGASYYWTPGGDTTRFKVVRQSHIYSVAVTNYCGTANDNITIAANPVAVNAQYTDTICIYSSTRIYTDSLPAYTYSWSPLYHIQNPLTPSPTVAPLETTEYFVTVSDGVCSNIDSVTIYVENPIRPDIDIFPPGREGFIPLQIVFKDRNNIGTSYTWDFGDGSVSNQLNPTHTFTTEDYFDISVIATTSNGCKAYDTIQIKTFSLYIPNLITPNGDGKNDTWELTKLHDELYVEIYNRWGDRVYRHDHYINEWAGENLSDGVYYYMVEDRKFGQKYKGWVQILRSGEEVK